jgi:hypothetical protein
MLKAEPFRTEQDDEKTQKPAQPLSKIGHDPLKFANILLPEVLMGGPFTWDERQRVEEPLTPPHERTDQ